MYLRGHNNILKRLLIHTAGFNLSILMRKVSGAGKPRVLQGRRSGLVLGLEAALSGLRRPFGALQRLRVAVSRLLAVHAPAAAAFAP